MTKSKARAITSNQLEIHENLVDLVQRHQQHKFLKPIAAHSQAAFDALQAARGNCSKPIILDACCGVGESTAVLAKQFPHARVIGVDKSAHRLEKNSHYQGRAEGAYYDIVRADLNDFWRLAEAAGWQLERHFLLYPNPWPKKKHLARRWHAMPVFPSIIALGGQLIARSNWRLYLEELAMALACYQIEAQVIELPKGQEAITPFERKYQEAGQPLYELTANLKKL